MNRRYSSIALLFTMTIFLCVSEILFGQEFKLPRVSPYAEVAQSVGLSSIKITYHRPGVKGRKIWGELVPYGLVKLPQGSGNPAPWRAGANENTVITFSHEVEIEGEKIPAGSYGLHMIPSESEWIIIFSKEYNAWGSFFYDKGNDALRIKVKPEAVSHTEWLEYGFDNLSDTSATVFLEWEKLRIPFLCKFDTKNIVLSNIRNELHSSAGFKPGAWYQAAFYCLQNKINYTEAIEWAKRALQMEENYTNRNVLGYLLLAAQKRDEAIAVFKENVEKYPDNWLAYDSLGEVFIEIGDKAEAKKYLEKSLKIAPLNQQQRIREVLQKIEED